MKKSRYTEEQIIGILKQHEAGVKTADLCREHGISAATFYGWKSKYGGMEVAAPAAGHCLSFSRNSILSCGDGGTTIASAPAQAVSSQLSTSMSETASGAG